MDFPLEHGQIRGLRAVLSLNFSTKRPVVLARNSRRSSPVGGVSQSPICMGKMDLKGEIECMAADFHTSFIKIACRLMASGPETAWS